jgi:hypothetical protein
VRALEDVAVLLSGGLLEVTRVGLRLRDRLVGGTLRGGEQLDRTQTDLLVRQLSGLPALTVTLGLAVGDLDHLVVLGVAHDCPPCAADGSDVLAAAVTGTAANSSNLIDPGCFGSASSIALVWDTMAGDPHSMAS